MGIFEERAKDKSDWTDQDPLTYAEAEERLLAERDELQGAIARAASVEQPELDARLARVIAVLEDFRARQAKQSGQPDG